MQYAGYILLRIVAGIFWLLPFRFLYIISNGLAFLLYKVFGYRRKVVEANLRKCFPDKSNSEIQQLAWQSYINLSDIIVEVLKSFTMSPEQIRRRYHYENYDLINNELKEGKSVLICGSHYCNWEWGVQTVGDGFDAPSYGVYKPLSNKYINSWMNAKRRRGGLDLLHMKKTFDHIEEKQGTPEVYIFIADQSPSSRRRIHWVNFMGVETACATGTDFIARKYNYPVYHFQIRRIKRGRYTVNFSAVCLDASHKKDGEITEAFMQNLEVAIRQQPANWLWSHKRWKISKETAQQNLATTPAARR